jgi:type I restriction enzyme, S subunit
VQFTAGYFTTTGKLPLGWKTAKLSDLLRVRSGYAFKSKDYSEEGTPLVRQANLSLGEVDISTAVRLPYDYLDRYPDYVISKDDILVGLPGAIGKLSVYPHDTLALQNQRTGLLSFYYQPVQSYVRHYFALIENQLTSMGKGIAVQNISPKDIESLTIPLPPLNEQRRIVEKIEELFTKLDAGVSSLEQTQGLLKSYRRSVLKAAVEGELSHEWREAHKDELEPASELLERILQERRVKFTGKKYKEPAFPDNSTLLTLPEGWKWATMQQLGEVQLGRQRSPKHHHGDHMRPYLRVANVFEDRIDTADVLQMNFTPSEYDTYRLEYGDILLNEGQSLELVGRPAMYRNEVPGACFQNTPVRYRPAKGLAGEYALLVFRHYLHAGTFQRIARWTTSIAHLGAGRFAEMAFPLPPLQEQRFIVEEVERRFSLVDNVVATIKASLTQADGLRQSILKQAFSGELVPQDPDDEPASVLLEQIRAERQTTKSKVGKVRKVKSGPIKGEHAEQEGLF